jgi:ATP-binding cassette subfamily B protein
MSFLNTRFRKFFSFYKPYRGLFVADLFCAVIVSIVSLTLPLYIRYITGDLLNNATGNINRSMMIFAPVMLGLIILQTGCALFYDHMGHVMGARMERDMRNELFAHYQTLPFSFFDREKTGSVISRLINDLLSLAELYHHGPEDIIIYALTLIGALVILLHINTSLALVICLFLPLMFLFTLLYSKTLNRVYTKNKETIGGLSAQIEDGIAGIRTVKSFGNEALETEKFRQTNEALYQSRSAIYKHEARYYTGMGMFFTQLITVVVVVAGGIKISGASLGIADFISFILYVNYLTAPIPQLVRITAQYQEGISGFNRFMDVMELKGEEYEMPPETTTEHKPNVHINNGEVEFRNVNFRYTNDSDYILKDISFKVEAGEYVAITGPSGIGKTTLCSLIPRFYDSFSGEILIGGIPNRNIGLQTLRRRIGTVQQDIYVFAGTIGENIAYGKPGAAPEEIITAAKKANAHDFIIALPQGYDAIIGPRGLTLSGGQRQRLCIARVFLKDPAILIFDEATSALDYESEQVIQESLKTLSQNRTALVIAHRESTIQNADRVFVLNGQSIIEQRR